MASELSDVQILQDIHNPATHKIAVDASISVESIEIGTVDQGTPNTNSEGWPVKLTDGTNVLGTSSNPLKIDPTGTTTQPISAGSLPLPSNASKETGGNLDAINTATTNLALHQTGGSQKTQVVDASGNVQPSGDVAARKIYVQSTDGIYTQGYTSANEAKVIITEALPSGTNPIGSVSVSNFPASQPVTGTVDVTNFPATQPVSGTVTVANPVTSVGVNNFPATQAVSGTVAVSNLPASQAVTGTFFQATQPVSAANLPLPTGASTSALQTSGNASLTTLATNLPPQGQALAAASMPVVLTAAQVSTLTPLTSVGVNNFPATQTVSGTVTVSNPVTSVGVNNFPATQAVSGTVAVSNLPATQPVSGSVAVANFPATQPISGTVTVANPVTTVAVNNFPATQPISAVSLPLPTGAATSALQTTGNSTLTTISGQLPISLGAKTTANSMAVNIASDQTVLIGTSSLPLPTGAATSALQTTGNTSLSTIATNTPPLGQALAAASSPVVLTAAQIATLTPLTSVAVNNFPATQAVSGTVTANAGTGTFQTNVTNASIPVTQSGTWTVNSVPVDGTKMTYGAVTPAVTLAASPTDFFVLQGSATKTIRVLYIELAVSTTSGSAVLFTPALVRRSAANTGGTAVTDAATTYDTNNAAATAVATHYTANAASLGAIVGSGFRAIRDTATNGTGLIQTAEWAFGDIAGQAIVLRGTSQYLCVNLGGTAITGGIGVISIEWTEE